MKRLLRCMKLARDKEFPNEIKEQDNRDKTVDLVRGSPMILIVTKAHIAKEHHEQQKGGRRWRMLFLNCEPLGL